MTAVFGISLHQKIA